MKAEVFAANRTRFAAEMSDNSVAVFFSGAFSRDTNDQFFYPFSVERNFFYLTGIGRENMVLTIAKVNGTVRENLYIPPVDEMYERWHALFMRMDEAKEVSGIENVGYTAAFEAEFAKRMFYDGYVAKLYVFSHYAELHEPDTLSRRFAQTVRNQYPAVAICNALEILSRLRNVKHPEEHAQIQLAVDYAGEALQHVMRVLKPGMYEYQVASHYQHILTMKNSRPRFRSVIAGAKNALILHYNAYNYRLQSGDLLLMDLGAHAGWYVSDVTRTYPVNGKFTQRQKELYNIVLEGNRLLLSELKDGFTEKRMNELYRSFLAKALKSIKLIKDEADAANYIWHGIGHPLGLDLHDLAVMPDKPMLENAVYTVEPALYIPQEGVGIRIEDNIILTKTGCVNLSKDIVKTVQDIENYMAG
ncbi:MAG: Xaa-Pro aminopeptidase [Clostridia bacterium]|nr:Xaa-Pro aminopeptidase [Clostridia bacterium]